MFRKTLLVAALCALTAAPTFAATYKFRQASLGTVAASITPLVTTLYTVFDTASTCAPGSASFSADALSFTNISNGSWCSSRAGMGKSAGKWYWEMTRTAGTAGTVYGVTNVWPQPNFVGFNGGGGVGFYPNSKAIYGNSTSSASGTGASAVGETISVLLDLDSHQVSFQLNCGSVITSSFGLASSTYFPVVSTSTAAPLTIKANFGDSAFVCALPTGYARIQK